MLLDFDSLYQGKNSSPPLCVIHLRKCLDLLFHLVYAELVRVSIFYFPYTGHTISTLTRAGSEENQTHLRFLPGKDNLHEDECQGGTSTGQEEQCSHLYLSTPTITDSV